LLPLLPLQHVQPPMSLPLLPLQHVQPPLPLPLQQASEQQAHFWPRIMLA
jgi:hypothetical protein